MKRFFSIFIIVLVVFAALGASYWTWHSYFSPTAKAISRVRNYLSDPDSAKFQRVEHFSKTSATCGYVNAKNRLGGYAGPRQFLVLGKGSVIFEPQDSGENNPQTASVLKARIQAIEEQQAFLRRVIKNCPE